MGQAGRNGHGATVSGRPHEGDEQLKPKGLVGRLCQCSAGMQLRRRKRAARPAGSLDSYPVSGNDGPGGNRSLPPKFPMVT